MIKKLSIIVPVFNEEKTVAPTLKMIFKQNFPGWEKEVVVVDDGSSDKTLNNLEPFLKDIKLLKHEVNLGKGTAIRTGLKATSGAAVIIQDADLEYDPADWSSLLAVLNEGNPVVFGSRNLKPKRKGYPHYVLGDWVLTTLVNFLFGTQLTDLYTCTKLFKASVLKSLSLRSRGFELEAEIACKVLKRGLNIKEVPINYYPRRFEEGKKIKFKDAMVGFWTIIENRLDWKPFFLLLAVLFLGAFLRFYRIGELATFRGDQAKELLGAAEILGGHLTLIGIKTSLSEVRNGAVMYYLLAPFLLIFRFNPVAGGVLQLLLSLATVVTVFFLGKSLGGLRLGLLVAFLIATSALLVDYARQTMLAFYPLFFVSLSLFLLWRIIIHFSRLRVFLLGLLLGFMLQVHYSTLVPLLVAFAAPFIFLKRAKILDYFLFIILGFLVGFSPIIAFELRHEFFQTKMLLSFLEKSGESYFPAHPGLYLSYWVKILGQLLFGGKQFLGLLFLLFLSIGTFFRYLRGKINTLEKLCLLEILMTALFILFFVKETTTVHYAIPAFIAIILLTGSLLASLGVTKRSLPATLGLVGIMLLFLVINFPAYELGRDHGGTMQKGWSVTGVRKAAEYIARDADEKKFNVAMVVDQENQGFPLRYFLFVLGKNPLGVEYYQEADILYVVTEPGINLSQITMWEITAFSPFCEIRIWPIQNGYRLYRLEKSPQKGACLSV